MTKLSKCLVVFVTIASLAVMSFAAATLAGGPNWRAEADQLTDEYIFDLSEGENPSWSVKTLRQEENVSSSPILPEVIAAARQDKARKQREKLDQLNQQISQLEPAIKQVRKLNQTDRAAMERREEQLVAKIEELNDSVVELAQEGVAQAQQTQQIRLEAEQRRADVLRLKKQLDEIQADRFRARQLAQKLQDLLYRVEGTVHRLKNRQEQLQKSGAKNDSYENSSDLKSENKNG